MIQTLRPRRLHKILDRPSLHQTRGDSLARSADSAISMEQMGPEIQSSRIPRRIRRRRAAANTPMRAAVAGFAGLAALALTVSPLAGIAHAAAYSSVVEPVLAPAAEPGAEHTVKSTLMPGETLRAGESISSASGRYRLMLHRNGNLVLYDIAGGSTAGAGGSTAGAGGPVAASAWFDITLTHGSAPTALWDTRTTGTEDAALVMRDDGDLVLQAAASPMPLITAATATLVEPVTADDLRAAPAPVLWHSRTAERAGAYLTVHDDGTVTVGYSDGRVLWTAGTSTPDVGLGGTRHVIYDRTAQRVWLVEADGSLYDTYPVSGRATFPRPGSYEVFSKSRWSSSPKTPVTMEHMVRFVKGTAGLLDVGFHSIPRTYGIHPIQSVDELGQPRSAGCVRQDDAKAVQLYDWAPIGTPVVVIV